MKNVDLSIEEKWKDIKNYEGLYQISNLGRVKKINKSNIIICKPSIDTSGYKQIVLTKNKKRKSYKIHRLIAQAFIPNPNNLPQINHKDENKLNNDVSNTTTSYNNNNNDEFNNLDSAVNNQVDTFTNLDSPSSIVNFFNNDMTSNANNNDGVVFGDLTAPTQNNNDTKKYIFLFLYDLQPDYVIFLPSKK